MNSNYDLDLNCHAVHGDFEIDFYFDPYNDCTDIDGLKDIAIERLKEDNPDTEEDFDLDGLSVEITDFGNVPESYANEKDIWNFAEAFAECDQEIEVIEAALYLGVSPRNIDEAYQGEYKDDEDFAQEMAEQLGAVDKNASWPMNCIDWEHAAKELMYDYSDHNGHYFRNL